MPHIENPAPLQGRASRVSFPNSTQEAHNLSNYRAQLLITKYGVRADRAKIISSALFGETCHG